MQGKQGFVSLYLRGSGPLEITVRHEEDVLRLGRTGSDTVGEVRAKIAEVLGFPPCCSLFCNGGQLEDDRTLSFYGVVSGSILVVAWTRRTRPRLFH